VVSSEKSSLNMKSIICTAMASCLEWYDFSIFVYIMPIISELFIPESDKFIAIIYAFGLLASGYLMRPLGGIFWGNLGDKIGRKKVLISCILLMALPMLIVAVLPTYNSIGMYSVIILIAVRLLQGFIVGGDSGVLVLLLEQADDTNRGFITSWFALVGTLGTFLSALTITILSIVLTHEQMLSWGWRIPFFFGMFIAVFALYMRNNIKESKHFEKLKREDNLSKSPVLDVIKLYPGKIFIVFILAGYIGIIYLGYALD
jgi:MFS transporter, MHS family, proline/betaine transporter